MLQRVRSAEVRVAGEPVARIGRGWLALVGVGQDDSPATARMLAEKVAHLRAFPDAEGRMNRSALDVGAEVLVVSQFTLYADLRRGRRPYFGAAAPPETARPLIDAFCNALRGLGLRVATGIFGAMMDVELINEGPVTFCLDTAEL